MAEKKSNQLALRISFLVALITFTVCMVMMPVMFSSIMKEASHSLEERKFPFTPSGVALEPTHTKLHVDVVSIDEPNRLATLRVNGFHTCNDEVKCGSYKERVIFFSVDEEDTQSEVVPASAVVEIPSSSEEVSKRITLPIRGNILTYPFDKYKLGLGVVLQREFPDKSVHELTPAETKGKLMITIQEQVSRVEMTDLKSVAPSAVQPLKGEFEYAFVNEMFFARTPHIVIVVTVVTVLSLAVVVFTVVTRPFDTLVMNVGATIFGIWGIRSLTLGGYPPDVTILDFVLTTVVILMLLTLTFRGMNYFHERANLKLFPWARAKEPEAKPATQECPECLSKVPLKAKKCAACGSALTPPTP